MTCPRCGLAVKVTPTRQETKPKIASLGVLMLLAAVGGPLFLEVPVGYLFGAGMGASGLLLALFSGGRA